MANRKHLANLEKGVEEWNKWRSSLTVVPKFDFRGTRPAEPHLRRANLAGADLSSADLSSANLSDADLRGVNLIGANLSDADLRGAKLVQAELVETNLFGANLRRADLLGAYLFGANLGEADLVGANLVGADLRAARLVKADLSGAKLIETVFGDTNLNEVRGLDTCVHHGPSVLDYRTIAKCWPLPLSFLRGCGLPDELIEYLPSLLNRALQFYSCFISYSTMDQAFAERLHADLQNKGVRCWFAPHDIQGGRKLHEQIDEAIRVYDRLLLILSDASMSSEWVKTEIANARQKELATGARVLFPISLAPFETIRGWRNFDADTGKDSAREIREYFIPDFSDWKNHDNYQQAFERLLKDLKAEDHSQT